jgi:hypothetical protein
MAIPTQAPTLTLPWPAISELVDRAIVAAAPALAGVNTYRTRSGALAPDA